jgi:hypothetical protein
MQRIAIRNFLIQAFSVPSLTLLATVAGIAGTLYFGAKQYHTTVEQANPTAELSCECSLDIQSGILVSSPTIIGISNEAIKEMVIRSAMYEVLSAGEFSMLQTMEKDGLLAEGAKEKLREIQKSTKVAFEETKCRIPLVLRVKNTGKALTSIVNISLEFQTLGSESVSLSTKNRVNIVVESNKLVDVDLKGVDCIEVPLAMLLGGYFLAAIPDPEFEQMLRKKGTPFVDFDKPGILLLEDQHGVITKTKIPLREFGKLMRELK